MREADPIFEMYIHEASQMIESTEAIILDSEHMSALHYDAINEIFRNMHTLKGSSAMIGYNNIANVAHVIEDLFHILRENEQLTYSYQNLSNMILKGVDYFKQAIAQISLNQDSSVPMHTTDTVESNSIISHFNAFLEQLQQPSNLEHTDDVLKFITTYQVKLCFTEDCQMENIRAYQSLHHLEPFISDIHHVPENLIEDEASSSYIREHGFLITFQSTLQPDVLEEHLQKTAYLASVELEVIEIKQLLPKQAFNNELHHEQRSDVAYAQPSELSQATDPEYPVQRPINHAQISVKSSVVSVNVQKLDRLMDLVGELVIAEAMLSNDYLQEFAQSETSLTTQRSQLQKITSELQDTIMSIRMVPLAPVFHRMRRLTRDMSQSLNKEVTIDLIGEDTEIDKSVIDQISDPLMHIVRNAIDHGIEQQDTRVANGKQPIGMVTLEARNIGSDVLLIITDDGQGLNKDRLIQKAILAGLLSEEQMDISDRDAYQLIFHPGLSTKEEITEFSGRGVGMDVVAKNIENIGGTIYIDSAQGKGTTITIKIPLTLAIIDGMNVTVGQSYYTLPTTSIKESFRPHRNSLLQDPDGNQMVMVRGECYSIVNLAAYLNQEAKFKSPAEGILIMLEHESKTICLQVDELVGQQQVVIKPLPSYFKRYKRTHAFSGCTLLGNGNISIILNMSDLVSVQAIAASY